MPSSVTCVAMPQMRKYKYHDGLSTASIAAGGTLGILIPPSVILVIYGLLTETSIGKLFIAGGRNPDAGPPGERTSWPDRLKAVGSVWAVLLLFGLVFGGMYGILNFWPIHLTFSPTEAAGMGAAGAFLIAIARGMRLKETVEALKEATRTTANLFTVLIGAWIFSNFVNLAGLPEALKSLVTAYELAPSLVIVLILLVYNGTHIFSSGYLFGL